MGFVLVLLKYLDFNTEYFLWSLWSFNASGIQGRLHEMYTDLDTKLLSLTINARNKVARAMNLYGYSV